MIQAQLIFFVLQQVYDNIGVLKISWLRIQVAADNSKFNFLQQLALNTSPLPESFSRIFEFFASFQDELKWDTVGFARLLVEVKAEYRSVLFSCIDFVIGCLLGVERHELIDTCDIEVFHKLLVDFAAVSFVKANELSSCLVKVELPLNARNEICNNTILCDENIQRLLRQYTLARKSLGVRCMCATSLEMPSLNQVTFMIFLLSKSARLVSKTS